MFSLSIRRPAPIEIACGRVILRTPEPGDFEQWAGLRRESRAFLEPWEPAWNADDLKRGSWRRRLRHYRNEMASGTGYPFLIRTSDGTLTGGISLGHVRMGVSRSAQVGYWSGERHAGKGYMLDALNGLVDYAFSTLQLHRIEAACIPDNERSVRLLEKAGFEHEGLMRSYLKINGDWRDHYLYARIAGRHDAS